MELKCLQCEHEFEGGICYDELGWHSICPECGGSFDVDVPEGTPMFFRYEAKNKDGNFEGIFSFFNPSQRRYFNRFLREPKWYEKNPDIDSRCWFTEEGYKKYHSIIDKLIAESYWIKDVRLLTKTSLTNIVCKGKIQCIEQINSAASINCKEELCG